MRFLRENSLSLVLLALFALSMLGQALAGWRSYNESRHLHHEPTVALRSYLARIIQCAQMARATSGGRFHPESCRLIW